MKLLWLCADDYAQNADISAGIRALYMKKHINAVSCLTNMPLWHDEGVLLKTLTSSGAIGLHLNFTMGEALSEAWRLHYGAKFHALPWVIAQSYLNRLKYQILIEECQAQLTSFCKIMGRMPDFVDGHQHVHQLPNIREALLSVLEKMGFQGFVRVSVAQKFKMNSSESLKSLLVACLGGYQLRRLLQQKALKTYSSFSGVYNFSKAHHYRHFFNTFLRQSSHQGLVMCHPGHVSTDHADPLRTSRALEYDYLMSEIFLSDLEKQGFILGDLCEKELTQTL